MSAMKFIITDNFLKNKAQHQVTGHKTNLQHEPNFSKTSTHTFEYKKTRDNRTGRLITAIILTMLQ